MYTVNMFKALQFVGIYMTESINRLNEISSGRE